MNMHITQTVTAPVIPTATAKGFRVNLPYADAVKGHEEAKAAVDAMDNSSERIDDSAAYNLIEIERNARRAVMLAYCADLSEAAARVVYIHKYWKDLGDGAGEAENAWPELSHVIYHLSVQLNHPNGDESAHLASEADFAATQFSPAPPFADTNKALGDERMTEIGATVRTAYFVTRKTRDELICCASKQDAAKPLADLCNTIEGTRETLQGMIELLNAAQTRIFIADAAARTGPGSPN